MMFNNYETQPVSGGAVPPGMQQKGGDPTNPFGMPAPACQQPNDARAENPTSPASPGYRAPNSPPGASAAAASNPFDCFDSLSPTSVAASGVPQQQPQLQQGGMPPNAGLQMPAMQQQQQQPAQAMQASTTTAPFENSYGAPAPTQQPAASHHQSLVQQPGAQDNTEYANYSLGTQFQQPEAAQQPSPYGAYAGAPPVPPPAEAPPAPPTQTTRAAPTEHQPSFDSISQPPSYSLHHANHVYDSNPSNSFGNTPQPSWGTTPAPSGDNLSSPPTPSVDSFAPNASVAHVQAPPVEQALVPVHANVAAPPANVAPPVQPQPAQAAPATNAGDDDFWASMGFGAPAAPAAAAPAPNSAPPAANNNGAETQMVVAPKSATPLTIEASGLPSGGNTYDCRINTSTLGVLFFKATDLTQTLYVDSDENAVTAIGGRPVVGHIFEGSAAQASGIGLGDVLLSVNGQDVSSPDEATHLVKTGRRPLNLQVYSPPKEHYPITVHEGKHMVKYDEKENCAPRSKWEWKPKYVVIGGVIAKPTQMNMYRSKSEYDTAVKETQAGLNQVSVKVKQFDLTESNLIYGPDGDPRKVKYHELWRYLVISPKNGYPIKIAANSIERLEPVHNGIKRSILASQVSYRARATMYQEDGRNRHGNNAGSGYSQNSGGGNGYDQYGGADYYASGGRQSSGNRHNRSSNNDYYEQNGGSYNPNPQANGNNTNFQNGGGYNPQANGNNANFANQSQPWVQY